MASVQKVGSLIAAALVVGALCSAGVAAEAAGGSTIAGTAYQDTNRNQTQDPGEAPFANQNLLLYNAAGSNVGSAATDAAGHYAFTGLADGSYTVAFANPSWLPLRHDWVPTTTGGSLYFRRSVALTGSATADFGLRPIVRSTTLGSPLSAFAGPNGLHTESYDDAVSAQQIYNDVIGGSLIGPEAAFVTIRFDYGNTTITSASIGTTSFNAQCYVAYDYWLDEADDPLFHEYGHAWSLYYANMVHDDPDLTTYLQARGLAGNPSVGSDMYWDPQEMIGEDYRQLFGTASAAAYPQANTAIPPAAQVVGLDTFLRDTFTQPPPSSGGGSGGTSTTPPPPPPTVAITNLSVAPQPVVKSGTVGFTLSLAASTTVTITGAKGTLVKTLLSGAAEPAGSIALAWNRTNASGQRVKSGTYTVAVSATDAYGHTVGASASFSVS